MADMDMVVDTTDQAMVDTIMEVSATHSELLSVFEHFLVL